MRLALVILGGALAASVSAQDVAGRADAQAAFAAAYADSVRSASGEILPEPGAVVSYLRALEAAWAARHPDAPESYRRLGPWAARLASGLALGPRQTAEANCAVWAEVRAPAFAADVRDAQADSALAVLVTREGFRAALDQGVFCDRPPGWDALREALGRAPGLAARSGDAALRAEAVALLPVADLLDGLYGGVPPDSAAFASAFDRTLGAERGLMLVALAARRAAVFHAARADTARALGLLDLVSARTTPGDVSRGLLRRWYEDVGGAEGARHAAEATGAVEAWLVPTGEPLALGSPLVGGGALEDGALRGRYVLLDFWSVGCPPCFGQVPALNALADRFPDRLDVVGVTSDRALGWTAGDVERAAREHAMAYPSLDDHDGATMAAFGVGAWPTYVLLGPDGRRLTHLASGRWAVSLAEVAAFLAAAE